MKIGYIRNNQNKNEINSPSDEKIDEKIKKIKEANVEKIFVEIFLNQEDKESENFQYNILLSCIDNIKENDVLVILDLNELAETLDDIINIIELIDKKNAHIKILDYYFKDININNKQLIATLNWVKNQERKDIVKRQAKGLLVAKAKKMKGSGRPKKYSQYAKDPKDRETYFTVLSMLEENIPINRISELLNISRNTIYSIKDELKKENNNSENT